jgi:uncharacterized protein (TIGR01777 family)
MYMQNNILILGGTGLIGRSLISAFVNSDFKFNQATIYILTRQKNLNSSDNLIYINHLSEIQEVVNFEIVINLAGASVAERWTNSYMKEIYDSRILTTRSLVEYLNSLTVKPKTFISASAVGYYGTSDDVEFEEESIPLEQNLFSQKLCSDLEKELDAVSKDIRCIKLRIGPVISKDGGMLTKLLPSFKYYVGSYVGSGDQFVSWIDIEDLTRMIIFIIANTKIEGAVNATAPNPVTNKEMSYAIAETINKPCLFRIPETVVKIIFGQMGDELLLHGQKVLPKKILNHGFNFLHNSITESLKFQLIENNA